MRFTVTIDRETARRLEERALREERDPRRQAALILRQALAAPEPAPPAPGAAQERDK